MIKKIVTVFALLALFLSSCSDNVPVIDSNSVKMYPVLSSEQVISIRDSINSLLAQSDASNDGVILDARLDGPELAIRRAQLVAKAAGVQDVNMQIPITSKQIAITNGQFWPRCNFIITDITQDRQSERLLVLNQKTVHDNYKLWSVVRLFANIDLPKFDVATIGSAPVDVSDEELVASPQNVFNRYADVLQNGDASEFVSNFNTADELRKQVVDAYQISAGQLSGIGGSQSQAFTADPKSIRALRTVNGGALAVGSISSTWVRAAGGGIYATPASDAERALFGSQQATTSITAEYLTVVAIYIPPKSTDGTEDVLSVRVVGAERYPVAVRPGG
ncbi:MAG: hypothetical protein LBC50_00220 [Candidatus Ancillula sp.]|jgi:hypothetical protein|nr:hypothetical protein [Candidatus Ancillula sp.]